jgi:MFS family permease
MSDAPAEAVVPTASLARERTRVSLGGYRNVLGDRGLLAVLLVNTLLVTFATSQMTSGFPAWVTGPAHSTPRIVGAAFATNTVTLVVGQLFVLRLIRGRRRTDAAAAGALAFALAWLLALAGGHTGGGTTAAIALIAALVVVALGESLVAPTLPAIVNDLAPPTLRGRYNAVFTLSWQVGPVMGPALAGFLLGESRGNELLLFLAAGCLAVAAIVPSLRRWIPEKADTATSASFPSKRTGMQASSPHGDG